MIEEEKRRTSKETRVELVEGKLKPELQRVDHTESRIIKNIKCIKPLRTE